MDDTTYDLVVVGLGAAGAAAAGFATRLDLRVAVVERDRPGGDGLWSGRVPTAALAAAGRAAHAMRSADRWGIEPVEPRVDLHRVWRRIRSVQAGLAATDESQRLRDLGVDVVAGDARISAPDEVTVHEPGGATRRLPTRFVLVATGSRPATPAVDGAAEHALTTDELFRLDAPPATMAIVGAGPAAVEIAQALQRLGVRTHLFERRPTILPGLESGLTDRLTRVLEREGLMLHRSAEVREVSVDGERRLVRAAEGSTTVEVAVDAVLMAGGRTPNAAGLGLEELGVEVRDRGIEVDPAGRTAVRSIYAAGDVTGRAGLANAAEHDAVLAVRDMFFPGRSSASTPAPGCVFIDPELATVGLTVAAAEAQFGADADAWWFDFDRSERARADGVTDAAMVVVTGKGRIVGAHVLAPHAGEMIHELALAVAHGMRPEELVEVAHVQPSLSSAVGLLAADAAFERAHRLRWLVRRR